MRGKELHPEVAEWLDRRQSALDIAETTVTPDGKTLDWVPVDSQVEGEVAPPPSPPIARHGELVADQVESDPERPTTPVEFITGAAGPPGHVPILRPDLSHFDDLADLQRVLRKHRGPRAVAEGASPDGVDAPATVDQAGYFHSLSTQFGVMHGCNGRLNVWDPSLDAGAGNHSISQLWMQNGATGVLHSLEAGLTVDRGLNGDTGSHLFTYYTADGYNGDGDNKGGYNRLYKGWVQVHASVFPGIGINGASAQNGSQLDIGLDYQLSDGNWWLGYSDNENTDWIWLGYYPASLFNGGLRNEATSVAFGGEVYSGLANPCTTGSQMGSGRHASTGFTHACFQRILRVLDANTNQVAYNGAASVDVGAATCSPSMYTIQTFMNSGTAWGSYQYFGGTAD